MISGRINLRTLSLRGDTKDCLFNIICLTTCIFIGRYSRAWSLYRYHSRPYLFCWWGAREASSIPVILILRLLDAQNSRSTSGLSGGRKRERDTFLLPLNPTAFRTLRAALR